MESREKAVICNALVEAVGIDHYRAAYERCLTSPRFGTLEALASHGGAQWCRLVKAAAKLAANPRTRATI
jgi:hypothetical protein